MLFVKPRRIKLFHTIYCPDLKGLAHAGLAKKLKKKKRRKKKEGRNKIKLNFYCFMCDYYVALISALVLLKCGNLRITVLV